MLTLKLILIDPKARIKTFSPKIALKVDLRRSQTLIQKINEKKIKKKKKGKSKQLQQTGQERQSPLVDAWWTR
jgi:hypothetical protein